MVRGVSLRSLAKDEKPAAAWPTIKRLIGYLTPHRREMTLALLYVGFSAVNSAVAPAITGWIVDTALAQQKSGGDARPLLIPVIALVVSAIAGWWSQRGQILGLGIVGQKALFSVREDVFSAVQRLSVAAFERVESGDLMSRLINDIEQINSFLSQGFRRVIGAGIGVAATLVGMLLVDWRLALATLVVVPVMIGATRLFGLIARRAFRRRQESIGDVSSTLAEELAGIKVAQAFNRTDRNRSEFAQRNALNRDANITASTVSSAFTPALAVISTASIALVAGLGGWLATRQLVTVGVVVAFFGYARSFFNGVSQLSSLYTETQSALAGSERVFGLLDTPAEITDKPDAITLGRIRGEVAYDQVSFRYGDGPVVLHDISLAVEAGTTLAIVGPTGAGKSTLVNLLARFYDPTSGLVSVDEHDLRDIVTSSLRRNLGVVLQDPFLFSGTIAENIRYGRLEATDDEVRGAARAARAIEFIERLPDGFETAISERGSTLSTGQRQLLSFARAILADPVILILDEATSSVDTRTELLIQEALREILHGRTAFVIAHRLSTVRDAGRIAVIEEGRIAEQGTYAELLAAGGLFTRLHEAQFADE
ncbi:MAG: ABC transporter ATP-binding protein [Coriobacteriia bacterium]|nr:ABC transporter ATP-binding protein [Coriobacteriia bacterium]